MNKNSQYPTELLSMMRDYYKSYYLDDLALKDWEERLKTNRLQEEEILGKKLIDALQSKGFSFQNKSILILGAGTGAEGFYLHNQGFSKVNLIEPNNKAIAILKQKAKLYHLPLSNIHHGFGENLPFPSDEFDYVICYTVLEHVQDVGKTLKEIHRVIKQQGKGLILTPNYNYPEEPHYKIRTFPPAYMSWMTRLHLKLIKRYTPFFETLNFITSSKISAILETHKIPYHHEADLFPPKNTGILALMVKLLRLQRNQFFVIRKN